MSRRLFLLTCVILTIFGLSKSTSLNCANDHYFSIGHLFSCCCRVTNNPNIETPESAFIESITGPQHKNRTSESVTQFEIRLKTVNYFPKNLETFFKNLRAILIEKCHLKEIHESDLKGLKYLQSLDFSRNKLRVIEQDLFKNNLQLESIELYGNEFIHIDPNVFDNLPKLKKLILFGSGCNFSIVEFRIVSSVIKESKEKCVNQEYLTSDGKARYSAYQEHKKQQDLDFSSRQNTIACEFKNKLNSNAYWCMVQYNISITTPEEAQINSAFEITDRYEAIELTARNDVVRFAVDYKLVNYFPKGLEMIFTNLQQIFINFCQLKEIHQSDLKPLQKLTLINLNYNLIEVIENDLFDFNKELSQIYLNDNKIIHIGNDAFSRVPKLKTLMLYDIPCLDKTIMKGSMNSDGVRRVIEILRKKCFNPKF